ncbi:(ZYRO0D16654g) [Zygosaccharomyces parabailii]|uniref:BN860_01640g1_1 n=1 Tax=Zygosaccharomyces bailii (strain CLIB 213 / ATCC 58445 / CBS 680 / BCRC 21525 / NBRC 1098 / NCYC 1416 / NRRL Y-2227) TaxID=1333698 RepID=A0A8J2T4U4_ZYGB2|nr:(ZYRO0D16654g) [Zygosaccharomyces parabailii]CDF88072.1 BN860_01640g1_1 [Zygosaccharomyces bailii CLIB 213]CDH09099.1 uncharacterized protein ZBAI_00883 [Zygosaccharomyces bailii ISA1307]SJM87380.1 uncharacterized protein ZBIST_3569 [Zygosaccharomyces bailii]
MSEAAEAVWSSQESFEDLPLLSWSEIRRHTEPPECWIVIHGKVYDVAPLLATHPGGSQVLLHCAGKDATYQFDDVGHSMESLMFDMPKGCLKGRLEGSTAATPLRTEERGQNRRPSHGEGPQEKEEVVVVQSATQSYVALWNRIYTLLLYCTILVSGLLLLCLRWRGGSCEEVDEEVPFWVSAATSASE